eukprot:4218815-Pyramimonas_sp.AAC.1
MPRLMVRFIIIFIGHILALVTRVCTSALRIVITVNSNYNIVIIRIIILNHTSPSPGPSSSRWDPPRLAYTSSQPSSHPSSSPSRAQVPAQVGWLLQERCRLEHAGHSRFHHYLPLNINTVVNPVLHSLTMAWHHPDVNSYTNSS